MTIFDQIKQETNIMSDWLHCNTCYRQPDDGGTYFITTCGHIYCETCGNKGWKQKCMICGTLNPDAVNLASKSMAPQVEPFISDPTKLLSDIYKQWKQLISVFEYQQNQRKRFLSWLQHQVVHQKKIVERREQELMAAFNKRFEELERERSKLKEEQNYLKGLILNSRKELTPTRSPQERRCNLPSYLSPANRYNSPANMYTSSRTK